VRIVCWIVGMWKGGVLWFSTSMRCRVCVLSVADLCGRQSFSRYMDLGGKVVRVCIRRARAGLCLRGLGLVWGGGRVGGEGVRVTMRQGRVLDVAALRISCEWSGLVWGVGVWSQVKALARKVWRGAVDAPRCVSS
jgi:hypothetical protein